MSKQQKKIQAGGHLTIRVETIHAGNELLTFKLNAHSVYLANSLAPLGLGLARAELVNDDREELAHMIREAIRRSNLVFVTGGLGPTFDDVTREAASDALGLRLHRQPSLIPRIEAKFNAARIAMPASNYRQAEILEDAIVLHNDIGTAPGQMVETKEGKLLVLLPGPPDELKDTLNKAMPFIEKKFGIGQALRSTFHIAGHTESKVEEMIKPLFRVLNSEIVTPTILASPYVIDLIFTVRGEEREYVMDKIRREVLRIFREDFFGEGEASLESVVGEMLRARKETLAIAESCTGGLIGHRLTNIAGSSIYFLEGVVAYADEGKTKRLGVKKKTLREHGSVSARTAQEMALGIQEASGSAWGLSVTGICGPGGGTPDKPVGLVYFGLANPSHEACTSKRIFTGDRVKLKERMSSFALDFLRREIFKISG